MLLEPNCVKRNCGHYAGGDNKSDPFNESAERHVCLAFPNGIPDRIAHGEDLHLEIADDQVGEVVFEIDTIPDNEDLENGEVVDGVINGYGLPRR